MGIYTMKQISNEYHNAVADLISKGYKIAPFTSAGGYSRAEMYIDFYPPKVEDDYILFRLWLLKEYDSHNLTNGGYNYCIRLVKYNDIRNQYSDFNRYPDDGVYVDNRWFYAIKQDVLYTDESEYITLKKQLQAKRRADKINTPEYGKDSRIIELCKVPPTVIDSIMYKINRCRGAKHATASCIKEVRMQKYNDWVTGYKDRLCCIIQWKFGDHYGSVRFK